MKQLYTVELYITDDDSRYIQIISEYVGYFYKSTVYYTLNCVCGMAESDLCATVEDANKSALKKFEEYITGFNLNRDDDAIVSKILKPAGINLITFIQLIL